MGRVECSNFTPGAINLCPLPHHRNPHAPDFNLPTGMGHPTCPIISTSLL